MRIWRDVTVTIQLTLLAVLALAERPSALGSGTIAGTVSDTTGAVLTGVTVKAVELSTNHALTTTTDGRGRYVLAGMPHGVYQVTAERSGFRRREIQPIDLHVNDVLSLDIRLDPATVTEEVQVEAPIRSQGASVGTVVTREFIQNLPLNGRSFHTLLELAPGVVLVPASPTGPGQFSVNGQRSNANYFTVDGVSANVGASTTAGLGNSLGGTLPGLTASGGTSGLVSVDALQEFRIQTSSFAPEFGRTPGANVSIVTRSGENTPHGTLFNYFRHDALDATDWFTNRIGGTNPPLRQNDFGGVVGGPIRRDEIFFFFSYEGLRLRLPQVASVTVPSLTARQTASPSIKPFIDAIPLPNGSQLNQNQSELVTGYSNRSTLNATSVKVDFRAWNRLSLFGRFSHAPSAQLTRGTSTLATVSTVSSDLDSLTLGATAIVSPRVVADIRANHSKSRGSFRSALSDFGGAIPFAPELYVPSFSSVDEGLFLFGLQDGTNGWSFGKNAVNPLRQLNTVGTVTAILGAHQLKVGLDHRQIVVDSGIRPYTKQLSFTSMATLLNGVGNANIQSSDALHYEFTNVSIFAQDTWRPLSSVAVTYGVRWDYNPPPSSDKTVYTLQGVEDPRLFDLAPAGTPLWEASKQNFAPRIGVSYALPGAPLTIRAGGGLFYDLGYGTASGGGIYSRLRQFPNTPFPLSAAVEAPIPLSLTPPYMAFSTPSPDLVAPRVTQWNVAVDYALMRHTDVSATVVGSEGRRLIQQKFFLAPNPRFSSVTLGTNDGCSDYRALQLQIQHRPAPGASIRGAYTWGRARDTGSTDVGAPAIPQAWYGNEYGAADFDIRHSFTAAMTVGLPQVKETRLISPVVNGWFVDSIVRARSAPPVNVSTRVTIAGFQPASLRPDPVAGQSFYIDDPNAPGGMRLNRDAFVAGPSDRQGLLPRNAVRAFPAAQWDLSLRRDIKLLNFTLQSRVDVFNVTNTPNFGPPTGDLQSAQFGLATQMLGRSLGSGGQGVNLLYQIGGPRSIQLGLKLLF